MNEIDAPLGSGGKTEFFLGIGEVAFASRPCVIRTVLGSCVGVSLYDPVLRIGGMCHYLLARAPEGQKSTRYGDVALDSLIAHFLRAGSWLDRLEARVAGGALILRMSEVFFVGEKNILVADQVLAERGIRVLERVVGGERGRRMILDSDTGAVQIAFIPETDPDRLMAI
jgi:chemotaxis protein CheD